MFEKITATGKLGAFTEETLSAIKVVVSFAQEELAVERYSKLADETRDVAKKSAKASAMIMTLFMTFLFGYQCYAFFLGSYLMQIGSINPATGNIYTVFDIIVCC